MKKRTIKEALRYRDFKVAGTKGITDCEIPSFTTESVVYPCSGIRL